MEQSYDYGLKFFTVKGAGHYVTEDKPMITKILLDKFLEFNRLEPKSEDNKDSFKIWVIVLIIVCGFIFIIVVGFIIIRIRRNKNNLSLDNEFVNKDDIEKEQLISDITNI